ncbi:hypothetical protein OUZ56_003511 [Daphnia magna]|uniref:Fucosyltransferase n=1 Tax=Daphnia magna TaxID=35525 RepID=A0ABR0A8Z2_9CRUS|nr:hypothetical protein OUZ56_003511 [Daphnia magna]
MPRLNGERWNFLGAVTAMFQRTKSQNLTVVRAFDGDVSQVVHYKTMSHPRATPNTDRMSVSNEGWWCSSKTLLCSSSSFLGAVLAVYYLCCQAVVATSSHHIINRMFNCYHYADSSGNRTACISMRSQDYHSLLDKVIRDDGLWFRHGTGTVRRMSGHDAIIFHARDINVNDLPPDGWRRPHHQHYVFLLYESPLHTDLKMLRQPLLRNYFDRTMTYRRDSDIVDLHTHGRMQCIDAASPSCIEFPRNTQNQIVQENHNSTSVPVKIDLSFKNRTVAWFVSHCNKHSRHEALARNLSQFIPVDMYDYVTEKLYRPLQYNAVPVVYGGADYSMYLPTGSYVNAMDFDSPERLANYLNKLMVDDKLYLSYYRWKAKYVVKNKPEDRMCQLCQLLGDPETKDKSYADIVEWWAGGVKRTQNASLHHQQTSFD